MMKKTLLLTALAIGLISSSANAITVDELDGKLCLQVIHGCYEQDDIPIKSYVGYFEKDPNTTNGLLIKNFFGAYTVNCTLSNSSTLTFDFKSNSSRARFYGTDNSSKYFDFFLTYPIAWQGSDYYTLYGEYTYNNTKVSTGNFSSNFEEIGLPGFYLWGPLRSGVTTYLSIKESSESIPSYHSEIDLIILDANATALQQDGTTYETYYSKSGNTMTFYNFFNIGMPFINNYNNLTFDYGNITGTVNGNTVTINSREVSTYRNFTNMGTNSTTSSGVRYSGYLYYWNGSLYRNYIGSNGNSGNITGKIIDGMHHFSLSSNNWANDNNIQGANLHTFDGEIIAFDKIALYSSETNRIIRSADKTVLINDRTKDVTHSVSLKIPRSGYGLLTSTGSDKYLYAEGKVTPGANADYVESYEIYAVPGTYSAVTDKAFNNTEKGHDEGVALNDYMIDWRAGKAASRSGETEGFKGGEFAVLVPATDLSSSLENYTFYVKTNYTAESGLEPTFHALATPDRTTGIDDVLNLDNDEDAPAVYYNMNGVQVDGDNLTPGLYIRRQGKTATKVIIK